VAADSADSCAPFALAPFTVTATSFAIFTSVSVSKQAKSHHAEVS
jgi:hypothetical protein